MAQQIFSTVELEGGKKITHYTGLKIIQNLFKHHEFEVLVPYEELEKENEQFFKNSHKDVCGKGISFSFEGILNNKKFSFNFKGLVTGISLRNSGDLSNFFVISGYSPTIILEDSALKRTFINKDINGIFNAVLGDYPGNMLKKKISARNKQSIKYIVQYNETNFKFLSRIAAEYGEWFYYNGKELMLGNQTDSGEVDFIVDGVQKFDASITLSPSKFKLAGYDYTKDKLYQGDSSSKSVNGLSQFGQFALSKSEDVYSRPSILVAEQPVYSSSELDELVKEKKSVAASNLIVFTGQGEIPDISVGSVVNVGSARPIKGGRSKKDDFGKYRIIEITHRIDDDGNYSNEFKAVPESVTYPPPNPFYKHPVGQPELAKVIDNNDPDKLGRVRVSFLWPGDQTESDWVRVGSFYSGGGDGKGMFFIPEVDAQVLIGYELNRPEYPFLLTSLYAKKSGSRGSKDKNEQKVFYTQAGNQIELIDKQGENKIQITNANKTDTCITLEFKGDGQIAIKSNGKIEISSATNEISISAQKKLSIQAMDIEIKAQNNLSCEATNKMSISGMQVQVDAKTTAELKASAQMKVTGAVTELNADGIMIVKAP